MRLKATYLLIILIIFITSCRKWKKTADINLEIEVTEKTHDFITVDGGTLYPIQFDFSGKREKGSDVLFSDNFSSISFDISSNKLSNAKIYALPQGKYTSCSSTISFAKNSTLSGQFLNYSNEWKNFIFYFDDEINIPLQSQVPFELISKNASTTTVTIPIIDWFKNIPQQLLIDADYQYIDGEETVIIDKNTNSLLYALIISNIGNSETLIFS